MKRHMISTAAHLWAFVAALAIAGASAASCATTIYAATVGSVAITQSTLVQQVHALQASPLVSGAVAPTKGASKSTVPTQMTAALVKNDILTALELQNLDHRGVVVTSLIKSLVRKQLQSQLQAQGGAPGAASRGGIAPAFEDYMVSAEATTVALEASLSGIDLSEKGLHSYFDAHRTQFSQVCLNLAVFTAQAPAQAAQGAVAGGISFNQAVVSTGGSGGQSRCVPSALLPPNLQQAILATAPGRAGPVVPFTSPGGGGGTGYVVFQVVSVTPQPYSGAVEAAVATEMLNSASSQVLQSRLQSALKHAALVTPISVNPADGTLKLGQSQQFGFDVSPPSGPPAALLPSTTSTTP